MNIECTKNQLYLRFLTNSWPSAATAAVLPASPTHPPPLPLLFCGDVCCDCGHWVVKCVVTVVTGW